MRTPLDDAKKVLARLQDQLLAKRDAAAELKDAAKSVSFDAFTSGGAARKKLDEIYQANIKIQLDLEGIEIAISEAAQRVADAEAAQKVADQRAEAKAMQHDLPLFTGTAKTMSKAAQEWKEGAEMLMALARSFSERGVPINQRLVDLAIDRALKTIVDERSVPPQERRKLEDLVEIWAQGVQRVIDERLGDGAEKVVRIHERETA